MLVTFAASYGGIAAAKPAVATPSTTTETLVKPVSLAGRWTGTIRAFGSRGDREGCTAGRCGLTLDIVACGADWCGIMVGTADACGATALKISPVAEPDRPDTFRGDLELAKGSDAYHVEAYLRDAPATTGESPAHLSLIGDTGSELLMMRRSFPLQAELARAGHAKCTLEKATS